MMIVSYLINRFAGQSDQFVNPRLNDSLYYSDQEKVDSYNQDKRKEVQKKNEASVEKKGTELTIDGWDPATKSIIDPINLWKNYETRTYAGNVQHGEKVKFIKRDGDGVLIETKSGIQGWVTYFFIREFGKDLQ